MIICDDCNKLFSGVEGKEDTCPECLREIMEVKIGKVEEFEDNCII